MDTELMRLTVVRTPQKAADAPRIELDSPKALDGASETVRGELSHESIRLLEGWARESGELITSLDNLPFAAALDAIRLAVRSATDTRRAAELVDTGLSKPASQVINTPEWLDCKQRVNDSLLAGKFLPALRKVPNAVLADMRRAMRLVEETVRQPLSTVRTVRALLDAPLKLPPTLSRNPVRPLPLASAELLSPKTSPIAQRLQTATETARLLSVLVSERKDTMTAFVRLLSTEESDIVLDCGPDPIADNLTEPCRSVLTAWRDLSKGLLRAAPLSHSHSLIASLPVAAKVRLSAAGMQRLDATTRRVLEQLRLDLSKTYLPNALQMLQDRVAQIEHSAIAAVGALARKVFQKADEAAGPAHSASLAITFAAPPYPSLYPPPAGIDPIVGDLWPDILKAARFEALDAPFPEILAGRGPSAMRPAGEADLYLIRQHITDYVPGEISHIENLMAGELRERIHRRRHTLEESTFEEQESEKEEERNLETTDRAELERETEQTVQETFNAEGGIQVSASYGPTLSVEAHGEISVERSKEESVKTAQRIAREVVEKARQKVRNKVLKRRERRIVQEIEETNTHRFDNTGADAAHRSGIYQWLDKLYRASVYSYGTRTIYDIVIPEPAASLLAANRTIGEANPLGVEKPDKPVISPEDLSEAILAHELARLAGTEAVKVYPQPVLVGVSFYKEFPDKEISTNNFYAEEKQIQFPENVTPFKAWITVRAGGSEPVPANVTVSLAGWSKAFFTENLYGGESSAPRRTDILETFELQLHRPEPGASSLDLIPAPIVSNSLPAVIAADNVAALAVTVTILCLPTASAISAWQREAYAVITAAYEARLQEWRDAQIRTSFSAQATQRPATLNPEANRKLEREELQRAIIEVIRNKPLDFRVMNDGAPPAFPTIDLDELARSSPEIRFLQQAFEWENLTYLLYPYFYGRPETWTEKLAIRSSDPRFEEFLKAGAARAQVIVRPGFKAAVDHYLMTGEPWLGRDEPAIGDELWLAFFDEERAALGDRDTEIHHADRDFDVLVPTSLVKLRASDALPRWQRVEDGWQEI